VQPTLANTITTGDLLLSNQIHQTKTDIIAAVNDRLQALESAITEINASITSISRKSTLADVQADALKVSIQALTNNLSATVQQALVDIVSKRRKVALRKGPINPPRELITNDELELAYRQAGSITNTRSAAQTQLAIGLLYSFGMRISNCLSLDANFYTQLFDPSKDTVQFKLIKTGGFHTMPKPHHAFISQYITPAYITLHRQQPNANVFNCHRVTLTKLVNSVLRELPGYKRSHSFRRTLITDVYRATQSVEHASTIIGHSDTKVTGRYVDADVRQFTTMSIAMPIINKRTQPKPPDHLPHKR
jgi:integrase